MANPLQSIIDIRKGERAFSFLMMSYFFLVITTFWIMKPLKKVAFLGYYQENNLTLFNISLSPANVEQLAKVMNMLVAIIAVVVFSWLAKHFVRQKLSLIFSVFFLLGFIGLSLSISDSNPVMIWVFYLYGDLFSTIMVATFFVFLNDSVSADGAKRLYGLVGLGGVLGGAFGTLTLKSFIKSGNMSNAGWMWVCFGTTAIILVVSQLAGKYVNKEVIKKNEEPSDAQDSPAPQSSFKEPWQTSEQTYR